ncbi:MAG: phosphoenolpyruvate--protein phosphotransferase [Gammaproteobacteria bacterium]
MSLALSGIGVSRGIAIGKAHIILRGTVEVLESAIPEHLVEDEVARFLKAVNCARQQLEDIRGRLPENTRVDIAGFIDTHLLMLDDATLVTTPVDLIREHGCNAEWALKLQRDAVVDVFEQIDDAYLRTRRDDVDHVINRLQRILLDDEQDDAYNAGVPLDNAIVLAYDLTPAETVLLEHQGISAFATECGGPLSHTAILARSMQIPALVGTHGLRRYIRDGETVILDGLQGILIAGTDERVLDHYRNRQQLEQQRQLELTRLTDTPAITRDGKSITLMANIELPEDIDAVSRESASGVGLYRTEFLFMNRSAPPDEEEQYDCYVSVIEALRGKPLTIRTLDMGADKPVDGSSRSCSNPALGLRAIRLCLKDHSLFKPQLRAILRASAHGPVRLMVPMLSNTQELHQVLSLINDTRNALQRESLAFSPDVKIGAMIEVPAAALSASEFASHMDFLSIGTNDLIQYTLAIDRIDDEVNYLYDPLHPAVLKLIKMTIDAGAAAGIPVSMCGEMAGDTRYTRLLLGMGLNEFSMHHTALQEVKRVINTSTITSLIPLVQELLNNTNAGRIPGRIESLNRNKR